MLLMLARACGMTTLLQAWHERWGLYKLVMQGNWTAVMEGGRLAGAHIARAVQLSPRRVLPLHVLLVPQLRRGLQHDGCLWVDLTQPMHQRLVQRPPNDCTPCAGME